MVGASTCVCLCQERALTRFFIGRLFSALRRDVTLKPTSITCKSIPGNCFFQNADVNVFDITWSLASLDTFVVITLIKIEPRLVLSIDITALLVSIRGVEMIQ